MESGFEATIPRLLELGLPGIVILALAFAVYVLYKDNQKLRDKIDTLNDKRLEIATDAVKALTSSGQALEVLTDTIRDRRAGVA